MAIFQKSVINKYLKNLDDDKVNKAFDNFQKFYGDKLRLLNIMQLKEENYQEGFLRDFFVQTLGYTINPDKNYNLTTEYKNQKDARKADGAILINENAIGVIELKSTKTKNLESVKEQAFSYKNNQPFCRYVITSNFQNLRFYIDNATEYEEFNLFNINEKDFKVLYLLLSKDSIFNNLPIRLKEETKFHEIDISDKLYTDYKHFKDKIFENLVKNNSQYDKLTLFKKSQKLLDRFLFIFFAEDSGLIPPNTIIKIIDQWKMFIENDEYFTLYSRFQKLFTHLDKGKNFKNWGEIPAYNGGLFQKDTLLDSPNLKIDDDILHKNTLKISTYNFNTEIDVNILGHIFEHSLNEIEEITAELQGNKIDKKKSKRKKEGVFYTPKYITKYIIENTIDTLCSEKKEKLQINNLLIDDSFHKKDKKLNKKGIQLFNILKSYKEWLFTLKILDPACGSGAFLSQTLVFLINEHKQIDDLIVELTGEQIRLFDIDKTILENNIYGVDINEESVEIAKLSLWLRTAQKGRKLSDLSNNIKCGNSLIDDHEIAGNKDFDWNIEFKEIMNNGGFDVIIGNPPYIYSRNNKITSEEQKFFRKNYNFIQHRVNTYFLFIEKSHEILKNNGNLGFIIPNTWQTVNSFSELRKFLITQTSKLSIINVWDKIFKDANVDTCLLSFKKSKPTNVLLGEFKDTKFKIIGEFNKSTFLAPDYYINFKTAKNPILHELVKKIHNKSIEIKNVADVKMGIVAYLKGDGIPTQTRDDVKNRIYHSYEQETEEYFKYFQGKDIKRYKYQWNGQWIKYGKNLARRGQAYLFENERLLIKQIPSTLPYCLNAVYVNEHIINDINSTIITNFKKDPYFLLAIINSKLTSFWFVIYFDKLQRKIFPQFKGSELKKFPIPKTNINAEQNLTTFAKQMLLLNKNLQTKSEKLINRIKSNLDIKKISYKLQNFYDFDFKTFISELKKQKIKLTLKKQDEWEDYFDNYKKEINNLQQQIKHTDTEIDRVIYELYELTSQEINIIEKLV